MGCSPSLTGARSNSIVERCSLRLNCRFAVSEGAAAARGRRANYIEGVKPPPSLRGVLRKPNAPPAKRGGRCRALLRNRTTSTL
jgi:acetylornithine deacetylase/succinyl-diaminopimelate desuccinylase-like protein